MPASPDGEPLLLGVMADSDTGKTRDALNTWRYAAEYHGDPASIRRVARSLGLDASKLTVRPYASLTESTARIRAYGQHYRDNPTPHRGRAIQAFVVDDASLRLQQDKKRLWDKIPAKGRGSFERWDEAQAVAQTFCVTARWAGVDVHTSFHHERSKEDERDDDGKLKPGRKGGMSALGPSVQKILTHHYDMLLFAVADPGRWPWEACLRGLPPNEEEHTKDRENFFRADRSFNTREALLKLGYQLPAAPKWEEQLTARFAEIAGGVDGPSELPGATRELFYQAADKLGSKAKAYRALFNGVSRAEFAAVSFYDDIFTSGVSGF